MFKKAILLSSVCSLTIFLAGWNWHKQEGDPTARGLNLSYIDSTVKLYEDFYRFTVGNWMKKNPVPKTESSWGSFNEVFERNKKILHEILLETQKNTPPRGSYKEKIGNFFFTGMDSVSLNKQGIAPVLPLLKSIDDIKDKKGLVDFLATEQGKGNGLLFYVYATQDDKNSAKMVLATWQGGKALPDRDFYLKKDFEKIRQGYVQHISKMMTFTGVNSSLAEKQANTIMKMETALAEASMDRVEMRDPYKLYNVRSIADLNKLTPSIEWKQFLKKMGAPATDSLIVSQLDFMKGVSNLIGSESLENWKLYLKWHTIHEASAYLSDEIDAENFRFFGTELNGVKERKPRWERVMRTIEGGMGEALGSLYVEKAFKPEAKERMMKMVKSLQLVFRERIQNLDWMSPETKKKAIQKLEKFTVKIGYPDKFRDYSTLIIERKSYLENVMNSNAFEYKRNLAKLGKPVDRTEWGMPPQQVNAYYNPSNNEIVFPAGILQPPFFDMEADDAMVYGAIGAVIGHEMTHGFDDQGRQYDADGNLKDWWTEEDAKKFEAKTQVIVEQFNNYVVLDTVNVNGKLTTGENIADLGGLCIAYDAFKRTEQGKGNTKIGGYTPDQRFFMSWANAWKNNTTNEAMLQQIMTDSHSPEEWRCNGPVTHLDAFHEAFNITGGAMYRPVKDRVRIW
ncbi:MAG: M13 family metallopeptidase [Bacteroidia bacterium]|nr:M13 family metallopeptidase [Bacteroidia bacterium]